MFPVERLELAQAYADRLAGDGVLRGLIGPREAPRLWTRHILNSAVLAERLPTGAVVADVGSGAGLPGIPLAIARPDLRVVLIEPLLRRATFLEEIVGDVGLDQVEVVRARAEDLHASDTFRPGFDVVTSRAVAPLGRLVQWCMPLVAPSGVMIALKGASVADEIDAARSELRSWGCSVPTVHPVGVDVLDEPTQVVEVAWSAPDSVVWPARRMSSPRAPRSDRRRPRR